MKILIVMTTSENVINFRMCLIKKLLALGHEVIVFANDDKRSQEIIETGAVFQKIVNNNRSINVIKTLRYQRTLRKAMAQMKPDIVFTFQAKPNAFGAKAAHQAGVKRIFSMVEGAGDSFCNKGLKWKLVKKVLIHLYKKSLKYSEKVFFLNNDDVEEFSKLKIVKANQAAIIDGIGVDLERFAYQPLNKDSQQFIMVARMLPTKGVYTYCKCANLVRKTHPNASFLYLGQEASIKVSDIQQYIDNGDIKYLGSIKDVREDVKGCLALILPSYREGKPVSVMEAEAIGRAILTTTSIGCKDTVIDGYNGYRVQLNDYEALAKHCIELLENKDLADTFGKNSRKMAEERFDQNKINDEILRYMFG